MSNDDYMTPKSRTNNLISSQLQPIPNSMHIFTNPLILSPPISGLKGQCKVKNIPVEIHSNPQELHKLVSNVQGKMFVVIETPRESATELSWVFAQNFTFPKVGDNVKVVTYPGRVGSVGYDSAKDKHQVIRIYEKWCSNPQPSKIKLRKIHSSKDIRYELASPQSKSSKSKQVFIQRLLYLDSTQSPDSEFKLLTQSLKPTHTISAIFTFNQLKTSVQQMIHQTKDKNHKLLLLLGQKNLKDFQQNLTKNKLNDKVQLIVFQQHLKPNRQLMKGNVLCATDNVSQVLQQLQRLKFGNVDLCRTQYARLSTAKKNRFIFSQRSIGNVEAYISPLKEKQDVNYMYRSQSTPNKVKDKPQMHRLSERSGASIYSSASTHQRYMRNWVVDVGEGGEYVTREENRQQIQGPVQPLSKRASRITARRNSSQSSQENFISQPANNLVQQYQRLRNTNLSQTTVNIPMPSQLQFSKLHNSHNIIPVQQPKASNKKVLMIKKTTTQKHQTKHQQVPSTVIQETSEEYRGSARESIVNLDQNFYHYGGSGNTLGNQINSNGQLGMTAGTVKGYNVNGININNSDNGKQGKQAVRNFSKVKPTVSEPAQYIAAKRIVTNQIQPSDQNLYEVSIQQQRLIDGLSGELIGYYDLTSAKNITGPKYLERNLVVVPYSRTQIQSIKSDKIENLGYQGNNAKNSGYGDYNGKSTMGLGYNEGVRRENQRGVGKLTSMEYDFGVNNNQGTSEREYVIDGMSGELIAESKVRMDSRRVKVVPYISSAAVVQHNTKTTPITYSSSHSSNSPQQILRPSHYIEPQIIKFPPTNNSISNQNIITQKKLPPTPKPIQSATSILGPNHNTNYTSYYNNSNNITSYNNFKVYTAEEYAARLKERENGSNSQSGYSAQTKMKDKDAQVINRVYIKASDLPLTQVVTQAKRYDTTLALGDYRTIDNRITDNRTTQYRAKLSIQDLDPFNQRSPSKGSSMRKGSYMTRKQDGKRDPFSPYEDNPTPEKPQPKTYTSEEYQKVIQTRRLMSPGREVTVSKETNGIDLSKYDRVMENGVAVYKPKGIARTVENKDSYVQSKVVVNGYQSGGRYDLAGGIKEYYAKGENNQGARQGYETRTYQSRNVTQQRNLIPLRDQRVQPLVYDSKSPMKVSQYKSLQSRPAYTYQSPTRHQYQRRQIIQPKVVEPTKMTQDNKKAYQSKSLGKKRIQETKPHNLPQNEIGIISGIQPKPSQILQVSDGSIMRRNNIKFGINKYRQPQHQRMDDSYQYLQQMKSRIQSKLITMSQLSKNFILQKKLTTQQQVQQQKQAYSYITTWVNEFFFLVDEQLSYLTSWLLKFVKTRNDKVESFRGIEQLYEKVRKVEGEFDCVMVFVRRQDLSKVNARQLGQECFVVEIMAQQYKGLQISQKQKRIKLSKLPYIKLALKIIIQPTLTHIILYQRISSSTSGHFSRQLSHLLSIFPQTQFIKQPYDSPLTYNLITQLIQQPKFSRLYIICNEKQMSNVMKQLSRLAQETGVTEEICKVICVPEDNEILKHQEKIEMFPRVAWMTNASKIADYRALISYALRQDEDDQRGKDKVDTEDKQRIFYHARHKNLNAIIQKQFPSRFQFQAFNSLVDVQKKILRQKQQKARDALSPKKFTAKNNPLTQSMSFTSNYLILHPIVSDQYIDTKLFKRIFMLGKSEKMQRKVVKVGGNEELLELLKG